MEAALQGAREIGFTVFSISVSLIAVFIPLLLMGGIIGRLFREFAITLSSAIVVSMLISLTTTPMMCSRVLRRDQRHQAWQNLRLERARFQRGVHGYRDSLDWVLDHSALMLIIFVCHAGAERISDHESSQGIFPAAGYRRRAGRLQGPQDTSFFAMRHAVQQAVNIIKADPGVQNVMGFTGGRGATNAAFRSSP